MRRYTEAIIGLPWIAILASGLLILLIIAVSPALAQEKKDNTGTNPANFTYDARFYTEMAELADPGGSLMTNYYELRLPLGRDVANLQGAGEGSPVYDMGKKFGLRMRARYQNLSVGDPDGDPFSSSEASGIGDLDARVLWMAHASKSFIFVPGIEAIFDTGTNPAIGSGANILAPVVFGVFPGLLGKASLFAPGYQYLFDISGDKTVSRSQIDLYFVWLLAKGKNWLIVDPQVIIDHESDKTPALCEVEFGYMIAPSVGASTYLRPGVGIGSDRPYNWNLEVGLKFVWR